MDRPSIINPHTNIKFTVSDYYQAMFIDPGTVSCAIRIVQYYYKINITKTLVFNVLNFGRTLDEIVIGIIRELEPLGSYILGCHYIVIEKQPFINKFVFVTEMQLIGYITHLIRNKGVGGIIIEVDSKLKTCWLNGPKTYKQNKGKSIKVWSKEKAEQICKERNDTFSLECLSYFKSKGVEDLSDTICYEYAWWTYFTTILEIPKK